MNESHWARPRFDFFHLMKPIADPATTRMIRYHWWVTRWESPTVNRVKAGSFPPKSLNTFANTGTMNATSASKTTSAKLMTTAG